MAHWFDDVAAALREGKAVKRAWLVQLDFRDGPFRVWNGEGPLLLDGVEWSGLGDLGRISPLEAASESVSPVVTVTLAGVKGPMLARALATVDQVEGQSIRIWIQYYGPDLRRLGTRRHVYTGIMDSLRINRSDAVTGTVEVDVQWLLADGATAAYAWLSDEDVQAEHPGDRIAEFVSQMEYRVTDFPRA